jgi:hypothetical protein
MMTMGQNSKALASLSMLISLKIWKERNDRVFNNKLAPSQVIVDRIKTEAILWVLAGAKRLGILMSGE